MNIFLLCHFIVHIFPVHTYAFSYRKYSKNIGISGINHHHAGLRRNVENHQLTVSSVLKYISSTVIRNQQILYKPNCLQMVKSKEFNFEQNTNIHQRFSTFVQRQNQPRQMKIKFKRLNRSQEVMVSKTNPTSSFSIIPEIHASTKNALVEHMGLINMTEIQRRAFYPILFGSDVVGQARTGTGKTLSYLVPVLQRLFQLQSLNTFRPNHDVGILIISPDNESSTHIADQADDLLRFHHPRSASSASQQLISVQVLNGARSMERDQAELTNRIPSIVSATPERLLEHLENTKIHARNFGRDIMKHVKIVVLDDGDRLMDVEYQRFLLHIFSYLSHRNERQTLIFSSSMPESLHMIISSFLRRDYIHLNCLGKNADTIVAVHQSYIVLPTVDEYVNALVHIIYHIMEQNRKSYKIVVFFPTPQLVSYFAKLFHLVLDTTVLELHPKKSPGHRHHVYDLFITSKNVILCTTGIMSRGVKDLGVTCVVQFGLPEDRRQYVNRLERCFRVTEKGSSLLVLCTFESLFLERLQDLDITKDLDVENLLKNPPILVTDNLNRVLPILNSSIKKYLAEQAYQSFVVYYMNKLQMSNFKSKEDIVQTANIISRLMGLANIPHLSNDVAYKMGLSSTVGISLSKGGGMVHKRGRKEHEDGHFHFGQY